MSLASPVVARFVQSAQQVRDGLKNLRIHMIGIGGAGMSGVAAMLLRCGATVSGSDGAPSAVTAKLALAGATVDFEQHAAAIPADCELVVASAAIRDDHPQLIEARQRGLRIAKYAQFLGEVMAHFDGVAISGTHGKSTTTAWLAFVLREAGRDPNFVVGATVPQLGGGSGVGDGRAFVAEACEYDRSFLNLRPRHAVILNIEEDHLDCYRDLAEIEQAFTDFAAQVEPAGLLLLNGDDAACQRVAERQRAAAGRAAVETFGLSPGNTWTATDILVHQGIYSFVVARSGAALGRVTLGLPGRHNLMNALAVTALALHNGAAWDDVVRGLADFRGASRRLDLRGVARDVTVVDDYAHHPTEIQATLAAARQRYNPARLWCIFQPHQHSRTRFLLADFANSFELADRIVVPDIYFVRDSERDREAVSSADLVERVRARGGNAEYVASFEQIVDLLAAQAQPGDLVLTMGAGTIWKVADDLLVRLQSGIER